MFSLFEFVSNRILFIIKKMELERLFHPFLNSKKNRPPSLSLISFCSFSTENHWTSLCSFYSMFTALARVQTDFDMLNLMFCVWSSHHLSSQHCGIFYSYLCETISLSCFQESNSLACHSFSLAAPLPYPFFTILSPWCL